MRIVLSDKAKTDLLRAYRYIEERNQHVANAFIRRVDTNSRIWPDSGLSAGSVRACARLRCLLVGLHLVFYTVDPEQITVVRVIDGRMDVDEEFHR